MLFKSIDFWLNVVVYGLAIVLSTVYVYGRLDFARSYSTEKTTD